MKEIRYFYLEDCCPITNSPNKDIKQAINKLKIHIEKTYNLKVEKVFYEIKRGIQNKNDTSDKKYTLDYLILNENI